jgi:hypothetical protein
MPRKVLGLIAALGALAVLPFSGGAAHAEKRVALVIGNGAYQNVAKLANPIKDATAVAEMFKKAGFDWVKMRQDVGNLEFKRALREFNDAAQDADIAVVYYAGHGIQIRDINYMIPVDAKLASEIDAEDEAVSLDRIQQALEDVKRLRLIILDACRDNPFGRTMKRRVAMRGIAGGLAKTEPTLSDTLIAYAAKAGSTADDGDAQNSPFAAALIKNLAIPGLDIRLAFGRVRDEVMKRTGNRQEPFVYGSIGGDAISLVPAPVQPKVEALSDVKGDYELVERIGTKKAWEVFLSSHKDGLYAELARAQLAKLKQAEEKAQASTPPPAVVPVAAAQPPATRAGEQRLALAEPPAAPKPRGPTTEERRAWERTDKSDRDGLRKFIAKYSNSPLAETAKNRLDVLDRDAQEREEKARADREAARQRDEEAKRLKAEEAARSLAEREAAKKRDEEARQAKANEAARKPSDATCGRDEQKLESLRGSASQGWAQEDLKRLQHDTTCESVRSAVVALLTPPAAKEPQRAPAPVAPPVNTPELIVSAQSELRRLGCFAGEEDGKLDAGTRDALKRYLSEKGRPTKDLKVTDNLVADLKDQTKRVCPLTCVRGEHPEGDRCIANVQPEKAEKPKATARERDRDEDKASSRAKAKREQAKREEMKEERRRETARSKPQPERAASRPQPAARSQAFSAPVSIPRHSGGSIVGVGF